MPTIADTARAARKAWATRQREKDKAESAAARARRHRKPAPWAALVTKPQGPELRIPSVLLRHGLGQGPAAAQATTGHAGGTA